MDMIGDKKIMVEYLGGLSGKYLKEANAIVDRWREYVEKVEGRVDEILQESEPGLQKEAEKLQTGIGNKGEKLRISFSAIWARQSAELAMEEAKKNSKCGSCGAELEVVLRSRASAVACPYCETVSNIEPGPATMWYYTLGVDALASDATREKFGILDKMEADFMDIREPKRAELDPLMQAAQLAWQAYYEEILVLHSDHAHLMNGLDSAVAAKMKSFKKSRDWGL